ncbi:hypothetical protein A8C56_07385 [Niabella ginsenosidivorans]|uniref:Uncharacterized protein n=1 Tax=Niabella ginsenosidivorans TaxID=1176587 RepID=A0A1A9I0G3_9BACT|nr:hypothetical protein A8C56_07385 [Niabella ginsenosidivorans]
MGAIIAACAGINCSNAVSEIYHFCIQTRQGSYSAEKGDGCDVPFLGKENSDKGRRKGLVRCSRITVIGAETRSLSQTSTAEYRIPDRLTAVTLLKLTLP